MKNSNGKQSGLRVVLPQSTAEFQLNSRPQINSQKLELKMNPNSKELFGGSIPNTTTGSNAEQGRNYIHPLLIHSNISLTPQASSSKQSLSSVAQIKKNNINAAKIDSFPESKTSKNDINTNSNNLFSRGFLPDTPKQQPKIVKSGLQYESYQSIQQGFQNSLSQTPTMKQAQQGNLKKNNTSSDPLQFDSNSDINPNHSQIPYQKPQSQPQHRKSSSQNIGMSTSLKPSAQPLIHNQITNRVKEFKVSSSPQQDTSPILVLGSNQQPEGYKYTKNDKKPSSARNSHNGYVNSSNNKQLMSNVPQLPPAFFTSPKKTQSSLLNGLVTKVEKDDMMSQFQGNSPYLTGTQSLSTKSARISSTKISSNDLNKQPFQSQNKIQFEQNNQQIQLGQQQQMIKSTLSNNSTNSRKNDLNDQQNYQQQLYLQRQNRSSSSHANLTLKSNSPKSENLLLQKIESLTPISAKNSSKPQALLFQGQNSSNAVHAISSGGFTFSGISTQKAAISMKKHKKSNSAIQQEQQDTKVEEIGTTNSQNKSRANTKHISQEQQQREDTLDYNNKNSSESNHVSTNQNHNNWNNLNSKNIEENNKSSNTQHMSTASNGFYKANQQSAEIHSPPTPSQSHAFHTNHISSRPLSLPQQSHPPQELLQSGKNSLLNDLVSQQKQGQTVNIHLDKDQNDEKDTQSCESESSISHNNLNIKNNNTLTNKLPSKSSTSQRTTATTINQEELSSALRQNGITQHPHTSYYIHGLKNAFKTPQSVDAFAQLYRQHFLQTCQGVLYSNLAKPANPKDLANKKVTLGPRNKKYSKTLVFDMDETLIHCNESTEIPCDVVVDIKFPTGERIQAGINVRPYAKEILKWLSNEFEIIIFTASHICYAEAVIDYLDPEKKYVHHRFFRDQCIQTPQGVYIKDLRIFQDRKLSEMVLIDNAAYSFSFQVENGIPIIPFYDNKQDTELLHLVSYLRELHSAMDVREYNKTHLKMSVFNEPQGPQKVYDNLFKK